MTSETLEPHELDEYGDKETPPSSLSANIIYLPSNSPLLDFS